MILLLISNYHECYYMKRCSFAALHKQTWYTCFKYNLVRRHLYYLQANPKWVMNIPQRKQNLNVFYIIA